MKDNLPEKIKYMVDLDSDFIYEGKYCLESFMKSLDTCKPKKILKQLQNGKYFNTNNWTFNKKVSTKYKFVFTSKNEKLEVNYNKSGR